MRVLIIHKNHQQKQQSATITQHLKVAIDKHKNPDFKTNHKNINTIIRITNDNKRSKQKVNLVFVDRNHHFRIKHYQSEKINQCS